MGTLLYIYLGVLGVLLAGIVIAYFALKKKSTNSDVKRIEDLRKGTAEKNFSWDVFYQKLYVSYLKTPFIKRYLLKVRRRLEINNLDDEFATRMQAAQIITKALALVIPLTLVVILLTHNNFLLMFIILIFELFLIDIFADSMVDKLDTKLLEQQMDFFAQMRHSYHENNMVAEAIYSTAQDSEHIEVSRQAEKIYEILNSQDPETELEKYYDIAPNNYLKEFAGISYLTQEFGDRKDGEASLYLKNLENITQEMQLEILKRDKLNNRFQSLSLISIAPIVMLEPLKAWALGNFSFTKTFYSGSKGMLVQILIMIVTFASYILIRKLKDNQATKKVQNQQNPWQERLYKFPPMKRLVDAVMPKKNTKEYRKINTLLKDAGSKSKVRWVYVNRIVAATAAFVLSIVLFQVLHNMQVHYIYTEPTSDYEMVGELDGKAERKAKERTIAHNYFLDMFKGKPDTTKAQIIKEMRKSKYYKDAQETEITTNADTIYEKLQTVNAEYLKWFEVLLAIVFAILGYMSPIWMIKFQLKMRQMEMEDEVMEYQTIIMMLMKIERIDVEMILEWLERYADIFKEPIGKCLNNYESGAWESLEAMKDEVTYQPFIRIIESLQTSVEKVPIREAFEELDSDREYYQDKRKETNDRLISKKYLLGKAIGFTPMVITFVGYLIGPLVLIGLTSMTSTMNTLTSTASKV